MPGPLRFEWDAPKAAANRAKHKVSFEEASTVFGDPLGRIADDPRHSEDEERFVVLGLSEKRRLLVVIALHLISVRRATRREARNYEESES